MKYIDIHSHLCLSDYPVNQSAVIQNMVDKEVGTIIIGTNIHDSTEVVKIAAAHENIWACIGEHPTHNSQTNFHHGESLFAEGEFEKLISNPKVVAIGECGLDYFKLTENAEAEKARQKKIFIQQIEFAIKHHKPLMIHTRDSYADTYEILKKYQGQVFGNLHFFVGNLEWANKFIELGFTISFVGLITYVHDFDKIIKNVPLTSILAETDSPFVAPAPYRGQQNEPRYVIEVYKKIAEIRGENPETVRLQLLENAKRVFGI